MNAAPTLAEILRFSQTDPPEVSRTRNIVKSIPMWYPASATDYLSRTLFPRPRLLLCLQRPRGSSQPPTQTNKREGADSGTGPAQFSHSIRAPTPSRRPGTFGTRECHTRPPPARPPGLGSRRPHSRARPSRWAGAPGLRADAREPARGRQGAGGSSRLGASPPRSPPPSRLPLTDFHSAVVEARGGGVQGVEAAVQRCGTAAQGGRLSLELAEDVPGAARQVGELLQQADQGVRADLLQRAEERRARRPGRLRLAQPRGLHGPLVEGHGRAGRRRRARHSVRPPSARGASPHPTQRKVRARRGAEGAAGRLLPAGERRGGRAGRTDGRAGGEEEERRPPGEPRGRTPEGPSGGRLAPFQPPGFPGRAAKGSSRSSSRAGGAAGEAASGDASPAEVCREAGKSRRLLPSLPIGEGGGSGGSAADTGREGGEAKERKGGGEKGRPGEPPAAPAAAAPSARGEVVAPRLDVPWRAGHGRPVWGFPRRRPTSRQSPSGGWAEPSPTPGPRPGRGGAPQGGGTRAAAAASPAPAAHLRFCPRGPGQRAPPAGAPPGPLWVSLASPSPPLEGGHGFRAASVDLKEDLVKSPSGQGFCSRLGVRASQLGGGEDSKDFFLEVLQVSFS